MSVKLGLSRCEKNTDWTGGRDLKFSRQWKFTSRSSGLWRRVVLC